MPIFQQKGAESTSDQANPTQRSGRPAGGQQTTVVAAGSRIQGEISGATDVLIDGQFVGQLVLGSSVVVGEGGQVEGQIEAKRVKVGGRVQGDIRASERIEVLASGRISGDVSAPRVAINAGAFFKGKVEMTSDKPKPKSDAGSKEESKGPSQQAAGSGSPSGAKPPAPAGPEQRRLEESGSPAKSPAAAKS